MPANGLRVNHYDFVALQNKNKNFDMCINTTRTKTQFNPLEILHIE